MNLPSDNEIQALHKRLAPSEHDYKSIYGHSQIVAEMAAELIEKNNLDVNKKLVRVGALLHDVGGYTYEDIEQAFKNGEYITHALRGYDVLKAEGIDEVVCQIALNHVGVGVTKQNIQEMNLPLSPQDYSPVTPEQEIVMYADKFHSKGRESTFNSPQWYEQKVTRFGHDHPKKFAALIQKYGVPDIKTLAKKHNQPIRDI